MKGAEGPEWTPERYGGNRSSYETWGIADGFKESWDSTVNTGRFQAASTSLRLRAARLISHPALGPLECTACLYICVIMGSDVGRLGLQVRVYGSMG